MEMPSYKVPDYKTVLYTILEKVKVFLFDAGKVIIAVSIILWFLSSHGPSGAFEKFDNQYQNNQITESEKAAKQLEVSYAGMIGKSIEPVISPLGFDWKIGIALITSFAAREVFTGTMSQLYSLGENYDHDNLKERKTLIAKLQSVEDPEGNPFFTTAVGISLMLFYAFAMQCMSTVAVVYRETKGWKWPLIQLFAFTALAYISSFIAYSILS